MKRRLYLKCIALLIKWIMGHLKGVDALWCNRGAAFILKSTFTFLLVSLCALAIVGTCPDGWAALIWIIEKIVHMWRMCSQHSCWFSPETLYIAQHTSPNNTCKLGNICPVHLTISQSQIPVETAPRCTFLIARHYLALVEPLKGRASLGFSVCCREEVCKCDLRRFRICVRTRWGLLAAFPGIPQELCCHL